MKVDESLSGNNDPVQSNIKMRVEGGVRVCAVVVVFYVDPADFTSIVVFQNKRNRFVKIFALLESTRRSTCRKKVIRTYVCAGCKSLRISIRFDCRPLRRSYQKRNNVAATLLTHRLDQRNGRILM